MANLRRKTRQSTAIDTNISKFWQMIQINDKDQTTQVLKRNKYKLTKNTYGVMMMTAYVRLTGLKETTLQVATQILVKFAKQTQFQKEKLLF